MKKPRSALSSNWALMLGIAVVGLAAAATLWWIDREQDCRRMEASTRLADERIVRDAAGRCYACRDEGWLYDIAFETCPSPAGGA